MIKPKENEIVLVQGGVAQYRSGVFYTGMEDPRWARPITWEVRWWLPLSLSLEDFANAYHQSRGHHDAEVGE